MAESFNFKLLAEQQQQFISSIMNNTQKDKESDYATIIARLERKVLALSKSNDWTKAELKKLNKINQELSHRIDVIEKSLSTEMELNTFLSEASESLDLSTNQVNTNTPPLGVTIPGSGIPVFFYSGIESPDCFSITRFPFQSRDPEILVLCLSHSIFQQYTNFLIVYLL